MQQPPPTQPPPGGAQYGVPPPDMSPFASPTSTPRQMQLHAEAASPINSRPPPQSYEELLPGGSAGSFPDDLGGDDTDRGGALGNRWPRQETLALLKIRSDMDAVFRDATLKGPLWEEVSRKLAELGYRRSAKKCKEKFENVHKYYKRTKENRTGRQDGKTYRFFSQLEALHGSTPTTPTQTSVPTLALTSVPMQTQIPVTSPTTIGFSAPMAGPSRVIALVTPIETPSQPIMRSIQEIGTSGPPPQGISGSTTPTTAAPTTAGISFSSNTESSESEESDDEDTEEIGGTQEQGKRKRQGRSGVGSSKKMMSFFEGLMKQVMDRQEAMQQRFLETIEKREQDRMIREEAWRRQEMARLNREQEILAQDRAMAAARDAAVVSFIQKITGQTVPLPTIPAPVMTVVPPTPQPVPVTIIPHPQQNPSPQHAQSQPSSKTPRQHNPQPLPQVATPPAVPQPTAQPQPQPQQQPQQQPQPQATPQPQRQLQQQHQSIDIVVRQQQLPVNSSEMVLSVQQTQDHGTGGGFEPGSSSSTSSRWPKAEVHALIKLRSGMDSRYQEAGPKGPLWEEISAGMQRQGYSRSAKRCKEKWENINKYFKKVKESNKRRPEDSKTCPYFHQLDALYRNKYGGTAGGAGGNQFDANTNPNSQDSLTFSGSAPPQGPPQPQPISQHPPAGDSDNRNSNAGKNNSNGSNDNNRNGNGTGGDNCGTGGTQIPTSNGGATTTFYSDPSSMGLKKPEDIMKELLEHRQHNGYDKFEEGEGDSMDDDEDDEYDEDEDDDDDGEDDANGKMQYKIQFQRPNMNVNVSGTSGGNPPTSTAPGTTPGSNSFLAMVK